MMSDAGRGRVLAQLRSELVGPSNRAEGAPVAEPLLIDGVPTIPTDKQNGPFCDASSGEEILCRDRPTKRYGVGVLYPAQQLVTDSRTDTEPDADEWQAGPPSSTDDEIEEIPLGPNAAAHEPRIVGEPDSDDFDLSTTTQYRPSAMAVSFLATVRVGDQIRLEASGGRYQQFAVNVEGKDGGPGRERQWWVRRPVALCATFEAPTQPGLLDPSFLVTDDHLNLGAQVLARHHKDSEWLLTVVLRNLAPANASAETASLFQATFTASIERNGETVPAIEPYPDVKSEQLLESDHEARSIDLLYRNAPTFGIGHGCAATWSERWSRSQAAAITAEPMPSFEAPSTTPDIRLEDGTEVAVPLGPLAGLDPDDDGFESITAVVNGYEAWIGRRSEEALSLQGHRAEAAKDHLAQCDRALQRMQVGLDWLRNDPVARRAFILANRAVLHQQLQGRDQARPVNVGRDGRPQVGAPTPNKDWRVADRRWRAFQIGFILAAARSCAVKDDPDRKAVELIFFPTGGGKTEAYQGLAAFSLIYDRLMNRQTGVSVIMRYTLRLLTSQQFLRAAALICALERIREDERLPGPEFSIGIWVGQSTTPTTRSAATAALRDLQRGAKDNPFLLLRCPWCASQIGPVPVDTKAPRGTPKSVGYKAVRGTVGFYCPDRDCPFTGHLPIYVVDDDVYEQRPSIVIATIDKFAMLAYRPHARKLFGLEMDGTRSVDPPNLIIQDELHLITGPLGSIAGLYETVIEDLCTDHRCDPPTQPKIVSSTATIRRYSEQIMGLYARRDAVLFPPHGLDASDSFFAQFATDSETGEFLQGKLYVGVHAPGLGSIQTAQVRTYASLLQAVKDLDAKDQDPWWTLMSFFNSLRELGTSVSLMQSDVPDYLLTG